MGTGWAPAPRADFRARENSINWFDLDILCFRRRCLGRLRAFGGMEGHSGERPATSPAAPRRHHLGLRLREQLAPRPLAETVDDMLAAWRVGERARPGLVVQALRVSKNTPMKDSIRLKPPGVSVARAERRLQAALVSARTSVAGGGGHARGQDEAGPREEDAARMEQVPEPLAVGSVHGEGEEGESASPSTAARRDVRSSAATIWARNWPNITLSSIT